MSTDTLKTAICDALATWIRQRPGLEFGNYGNVSSYRSEMRGISKDKRDAETLLQAVRWRDSITGEKLLDAFKHAYSGRLSARVFHKTSTGECKDPKHEVECLDGNESRVELDYTTGQYWPTEHRKAAAAVLASALWEWQRDNMPAANGKLTRKHGPFETTHDNIDGVTPGDWLRRSFRKEFGSALQRRWFN